MQKDSLLGIYGSDVIALKVIESLHLTSNQMSLARIASRDIRPAKPMGLVPSSILEGPIIKSGQRCCSFSYDEKFAIKCAEYIVEARSRLTFLRSVGYLNWASRTKTSVDAQCSEATVAERFCHD